MAAILTYTKRLQATRRPWRKNVQRFSQRLICCSCLRAEEVQLAPGQVDQGEGEPRASCLVQEVSKERETIQITVEDVGLVNLGLCLSEEDEEDSLASRSAMACLASSVSSCQRVMKKKTLKALSSLPLQTQTEPVNLHITEDDDDEEEEDDNPVMFKSDSTPTSESFLMPPVINLIPPTPSNVIDDDQFFDITSEDESVSHTSGSDGTYVTEDPESCEESTESVETRKTNENNKSEKGQDTENGQNDPGQSLDRQAEEKEKAVLPIEGGKENPKRSFLRIAYQVAPLPEYPRKRSFNTGVNMLSFAEHIFDDLNNKDASFHELLKAELHLRPLTARLDSLTHLRKKASCSCSLGDTVTSSNTFHSIPEVTVQHQEEEGLPRQRRVTVASYMPQSKDQNGNFDVKDLDRQGAKSLGDLNLDEVCQWFSSIGLQKCLPFIREAGLCGADVSSLNVDTLQLLHISSLEEREQLLSAIYKELHPPNASTQRLDSLLETYGPYNVERFTAALVSMSKSKSSSHVSSVDMNRGPLKLRSKSPNYMEQRNPQLIEITINASEQIVHLRTPTETTVGKVMESCIKMLGMTESKDLFRLRDTSEELSPEQKIGSLPSSENQQLELHLCKKGNLPGKEEKIRELNQQVDSLQNVILQVQELHHGLVAFCSELKKMDGEVDVAGLGSAELEQRLEEAQFCLRDKRQNLQALKDTISNAAAHRNKQSEVRLLEKMKINCQVFQEEISLVHLNRHVAHLQSSLQECQVKEKAQKKCSALSSLSQLVSPRCPAMLLVVQENLGPDGHYGFSCSSREARGLVVVQVDNSRLCLHDKLVEVNGVPVVGYTEEELNALLLQGASAQIVVLRRPPPSPRSQQHTLLGHHDSQEPITMVTDRITATETPQHRELLAI